MNSYFVMCSNKQQNAPWVDSFVFKLQSGSVGDPDAKRNTALLNAERHCHFILKDKSVEPELNETVEVMTNELLQQFNAYIFQLLLLELAESLV